MNNTAGNLVAKVTTLALTLVLVRRVSQNCRFDGHNAVSACTARFGAPSATSSEYNRLSNSVSLDVRDFDFSWTQFQFYCLYFSCLAPTNRNESKWLASPPSCCCADHLRRSEALSLLNEADCFCALWSEHLLLLEMSALYHNKLPCRYCTYISVAGTSKVCEPTAVVQWQCTVMVVTILSVPINHSPSAKSNVEEHLVAGEQWVLLTPSVATWCGCDDRTVDCSSNCQRLL